MAQETPNGWGQARSSTQDARLSGDKAQAMGDALVSNLLTFFALELAEPALRS